MPVSQIMAPALPSPPAGSGRPGAAAQRARRIIAVGGGKGGVGKSLVAANLGVFLAQVGKRVVLVDGDLGGANLHTFLGVDPPRLTLGDFIDRRIGRLEDVVAPTPLVGLGLISGARDALESTSPRASQRSRLLSQLRSLDVDYLVLDIGAGTGPVALDLFFAADEGVVVVNPEPTSVDNCYRFLAATFLRRCTQVAELSTLKAALAATARDAGARLPWPAELLSLAVSKSPELGARVRRELAKFCPRLIINQARAKADFELGLAMRQCAWRALGVQLDLLGVLESDDLVTRALRRKTPILVEHPDARICREFDHMARRLIHLAHEEARPSAAALERYQSLTAETYYDLLDVSHDVGDEEIRRAYRRAKAVFAPDSVAAYGIFERAERESMLMRLDQAHDVLVDPERRRAYDRRAFPEGRPARLTLPPSGPPTPVPPTRGRINRPSAATPRPAGALPMRSPSMPTPIGVPVVDVSPRGGGPTAVPTVTASITGLVPDGAPAPLPTSAPVLPLELDGEVTGETLRGIREAQGISLEEIAQVTKITVSQLRALEEEKWSALLAQVYVRGFVHQLARALRLDADDVARRYLARYKNLTRGRE
jgi:flagellar biosynthesis protein FlhG